MSTYAEIYTDGSCDWNPGGNGGWAAVFLWGDGRRDEIWGRVPKPTTSNRMEITAAIHALAMLPEHGLARIFTDSMYLKKGATEWLVGWKRRNWLRESRNGIVTVPNSDLWQELDKMISMHIKIEWNYVRGHFESKENNRADYLANAAINRFFAHERRLSELP